LVKVAKTVNLYEAKTHLSKLVERAAKGEEVIIAKAGEPKARLVPLARPVRNRKPGDWKGRIVIEPDFDAPLPDEVLAAAGRLEAECSRRSPDPGAVDLAHADLHHALVSAAGSTRITEAHAAMDAETRVYLLQLRPLVGPEGMAADHRALLQGLVTDGPEALRQHIVEATERLIAATDET
jgi:prevent-host-death family protein